MKTTFILMIAFCFLLMSQPISAFTGLVVRDGERALVGNNEDWFNPRSKIWFIQPVNGRFGLLTTHSLQLEVRIETNKELKQSNV